MEKKEQANKGVAAGAFAVACRSYLSLALLALVLFDLGARLTWNCWDLDCYVSPNRSWIWWATRDFKEMKEKPDIVLMGSSLMMAALHGGDATYLKKPQNVAYHHRCLYLEDLLGRQLQSPLHTFAFAIGGQMASDAYVIASTLLKGDRKPKTIVYGIAPRDFMDNTLSSPASTETFRYMSRVGQLDDIGWQSRTSFWEQAEYALSKVSFLYQRRLDFVYLQNHYARVLLKKCCGAKDLEFVRSPLPLRKIAMLELPEDNGPNELSIWPFEKASYKYIDNLPEYRRRYASFKKKVFDGQLSFLERLLKYCQDEGISLVLVNMPLTQDNVALIPPGLYDFYLNSVRGLASKYQARVLDLNEPAVFPKEYFADSVHMNGDGGMRFFEVLSGKLLEQSNLAAGKSGSIH